MMPLHDTVQRWWAGQLGATGTALDVLTAPAELLYRGITGTRNALYDAGTFASVHLSVPVISIGNVAVGGTGKTPVTAWLARTLRSEGASPAVLHGGYAPDEPALHALLNPEIPVYAGRDRAVTGAEAIAKGADVLLLDDAFQHRRLVRDLDIVLVAAETWHQPHRTLPRGPWREPSSALRRAGHIVITGRTSDIMTARAVMAELGRMTPNVTIVSLRATTWRRGDHVFGGDAAGGDPLILVDPGVGRTGAQGAPTADVFIVCGIARPDAFVQNVADAGVAVGGKAFFPDHHAYTVEDAVKILERAGSRAIVTTAKDWVKLAPLLPADRVWVLRQSVELEDGGERLLAAVRAVLS